MIISQDVHPQRDLYYVGALVLDLLATSKDAVCDYFDIYNALKREHGISLNAFVLALDWLYLLESIENDDQGGIRKCF